MTFLDKVQDLHNKIDDILPSFIGDKCVFLDLPYYENIGDVLIWEGTEWFLKYSGISCIYSASKDTFDWRSIPKDATIILQGGGNFGDVWLPHQKFRLDVIQKYPNNKIIVLPQTIYYQDINNMKREAAIMAEHSNLIICSRDSETHQLVKDNFSNETLLLPDMAFCIPVDYLTKYRVESIKDKNLFLKRKDKEVSAYDYYKYINCNVEEHDWPSYETVTETVKNYRRLVSRKNLLEKIGCGRLVDIYAKRILRKHYVKTGVEFISSYDYIYTTRLHVAILSTLLGKPFTFFDNSYGKNSSFYNTWLSDVQEIKFVYA